MSIDTSTPTSKKRKAALAPAPSIPEPNVELPVAKSADKDDEAAEEAAEGDAADQEQEEEEIEAISHAEQRKRRKLEKKKAKSTSSTGEAEAPTQTADAADTNKDTQKRSGFGIWAGNLSFSTDADKVREFFKSCGTITRFHMPKGNGKLHHNKGFVYIDFKDQEEVDKAIKLSEGHLDGRRLLIKDSKSYEGRPQGASSAANAVLAASIGGDAQEARPTLSKTARKILDKQKNPPAPTLFYGNLGFETEEAMIREMLENHAESNNAWKSKKVKRRPKPSGIKRESGDSDASGSEASESEAEEPVKKGGSQAGIRRIRMGTFEDSGKCKGWAFVDFHLTSQATLSLIDLRNHHLNGRDLKVEYASADAVRRGGGRMDGEVKKPIERVERTPGQQRPPRSTEVAEPEVEEDESAPAQAFYRPPLASNPYAEAAKIHKPNKDERAALRNERKKAGAKRQKPGAALAEAQREKVAIQPSQGKKITF